MRFQRYIPFVLFLTIVLSDFIPPKTANGGTISYSVAINTSSISGTAGDIEFQLATAGDGVPIATTFTSYSSDAALSGPTGYLISPNPPATTLTGDLIANTLSLYNDDAVVQIADADQLVSSFGGFMSFVVTLSGDSIGLSTVSTPTLGIFVYSGAIPLGNGPNGEVATLQVNSDGTVAVTNDNSVSTVASVPEPSSIACFGIGVLGIILIMKRREVARSA